MTWAARILALQAGPTRKALLFALAELAHPRSGDAFVTPAALQLASGLAVSTLRAEISSAKEAGLISFDRRRGKPWKLTLLIAPPAGGTASITLSAGATEHESSRAQDDPTGLSSLEEKRGEEAQAGEELLASAEWLQFCQPMINSTDWEPDMARIQRVQKQHSLEFLAEAADKCSLWWFEERNAKKIAKYKNWWKTFLRFLETKEHSNAARNGSSANQGSTGRYNSHVGKLGPNDPDPFTGRR